MRALRCLAVGLLSVTGGLALGVGATPASAAPPFSATLTLPQGQSYRYRYLVDGHRWVDDPAPDEYIDNSFGTKDSVVVL